MTDYNTGCSFSSGSLCIYILCQFHTVRYIASDVVTWCFKHTVIHHDNLPPSEAIYHRGSNRCNQGHIGFTLPIFPCLNLTHVISIKGSYEPVLYLEHLSDMLRVSCDFKIRWPLTILLMFFYVSKRYNHKPVASDFSSCMYAIYLAIVPWS